MSEHRFYDGRLFVSSAKIGVSTN